MQTAALAAELRKIGTAEINHENLDTYVLADRPDRFVWVTQHEAAHLLPLDCARHLKSGGFPLPLDLQASLREQMPETPMACASEAQKLAMGAAAVRALLARFDNHHV
jgi:hypothetical protein